MLCSWARRFTLTVPLFTLVYKWVPANLRLGVAVEIIEIILVASFYRDVDELRPGGRVTGLVCRLDQLKFTLCFA